MTTFFLVRHGITTAADSIPGTPTDALEEYATRTLLEKYAEQHS
jgi:hypothetical protein